MHKRKRTTLAAICLAAFALAETNLANAESKFAIAGSGSTSCGQYLNPPGIKKSMSDMIMVTWIQGYLSGTNTQRFMDSEKKMKVQPDSQSIIAFVDKFCRDNPLKSVYEASLLLDMSY